jgi:DNA-binding CsgD family transcriptional regulator
MLWAAHPVVCCAWRDGVGRMLLARTTERERIDALLDAARHGRGGAVVLLGEPGIGKTTLLDHARRRAEGMLVLAGRGIEAEAELPFAGLSVLLTPLLNGLEAVARPQREALCGALGLGPARPGARFAIYAGALALLAHEAEERTLAVLVDDAHWLDRASAEALLFCARRLERERIALLLAARDEDGKLLDTSALPQLRLTGLDVSASMALLRSTAGVDVTPRVARHVHEATAGNPLALREIACSLRAEQLAGAEPLPTVLGVGRDLQRALGRRIDALPYAARAALLVVAANDSGAVDELARALGRLSLGLSALAPAETASIVAITDDKVEFCHPLLRSAAYVGAPPPRRREAHAAVAAALGDTGQRVRRAWHLALASLEPDEAVAAEIELAAHESRARAAPAASGRAFAAAARLTPRGEHRNRRLVEGANDLYLAGSPEAALALLDEALSSTEEIVPRADVQRLRARAMAMRSPLAATRDLLVSEAASVEPRDSARAAAMLLDAAFSATAQGDLAGATRLAERAFPALDRRGGSEALVAASLLGSLRILAGDPRGGYPLIRKATRLVETADVSLLGSAAALNAHAYLWLGRCGESRRLLAQIVAACRARSEAMALPTALAWLAEVDLRLGNWSAALAEASESVRLGEEIGRAGDLVNGLVVLAGVQAVRGDADARATIARAQRMATAIDTLSMAFQAVATLGLLELSEGRLDEATDALNTAARLAREMGLEEPNVVLWAQDHAEAHARLGSRAEAEATIAVLEGQAQRTGRRLAHAGVARCRGLLARESDFEEDFRRALDWHDGVDNAFERARTELCFGERLLRARRRRDSRDWLHRALETFDGLGAARWAERARRELAASGERARRRTPATADHLTPKELQVAMVVAEGATNREAASALFVTPKTVESHLNSIYRKLGVRSRVELVRRLEHTTK